MFFNKHMTFDVIDLNHNMFNLFYFPKQIDCSIDVTYFPFDDQTCIIELTSWALPWTELKLEPLWNIVQIQLFRWVNIELTTKSVDLKKKPEVWNA